MSRLTPPQKPAPFVFPRGPLTPPETTADFVEPAHVSTSTFLSAGHEQRSSEIEPSPAYSAPTPERPETLGSRFRRASSITYHSSALREPRERTPQRGTKPFVIVIPPPSFNEQHGQLGHTLSSGPRHRLSQGLLMPLFPTMYGQLNAIAREYNFPSIAGLCLYPHFSENGVTMTPRISDESWPLFWGHVLDSSSSPRSPVSGKIEFDIDRGQARWYVSWLGSAHRDYTGQTFSANPSTPPSISHGQGESRKSFLDDDQESRVIAPTARHIPRKLSLVDRYDLASTRPGSLSASRSAMSPDHAQIISQALSPIFQEEEPKSARNGLDDRVKEWRASTIPKPTPLAATGQISLEPPNMPNALPIEESLLIASNGELKLEDYIWSPSSKGPSDHDWSSLVSPARLPSVHIASRMEGSVSLTPSDCTSFGPSDYTLPSPQPSMYRLPSPDIAYRMYEDVPLTPSTATSWGPPLEYPPSPFSIFRAPSIDLGERSVFSRPATPSTITNWGLTSLPTPPICSDYKPQSADCGAYSRLVASAPRKSPPAPDLSHHGSKDLHAPPMDPCAPWKHSWPYINASYLIPDTRLLHTPIAQQCRPWGHLWPYAATTRLSDAFRNPSHMPLIEEGRSLPVLAPSVYPHLVLYQPVYPHFDLYPAALLSRYAVEENLPSDPCPIPCLNTPSQLSRPLQPVTIKLEPNYPFFDLYPATYPGNLSEIYAPVDIMDKSATVDFPYFDLYPAADLQYMQPSVLYKAPGVLLSSAISDYPDFNIYPAVGPPHATQDSLSSAHVRPRATYPYLALYPGVYPHLDIYPPAHSSSDYVVPHSQLQSRGTGPSTIDPTSLAEHTLRPFFNKCEHDAPKASIIRGPCLYPIFDLYPAVYPFIEIYPSLLCSPDSPVISKDENPNVCPLIVQASDTKLQDRCGTYVNSPRSNKTGRPYSCTGAHVKNESSKLKDISTVSLTIQAHYPSFDLYPAVYPYFNLWPLLDCPRMTSFPKSSGSRGKSAHSRLTHSELHAMVMMERIGSSESFRSINSKNSSSSLKTTLHDRIGMEFTEGFDAHGSSFYEPVKSLSDELLARRRAPSLKHSIQYEPNSHLASAFRSAEGKFPPSPILPHGPVGNQRTALSRPSSSINLARQRLNQSELNSKLGRSTSLSASVKPIPSKRDSIVSQRVRAFNATEEGTSLSMDTLSRFPAPPNALITIARS